MAKDEQRAAKLFAETCTNGDEKACAVLAALHENGRAVEKDPERVKSLCERARHLFEKDKTDPDEKPAACPLRDYDGGL